MALVDPNFPSLMNSLSGLALEERTRRANLVEHIESLEEELLLLNHSTKIMAEHGEFGVQWLQETRRVFRRAEDLVSNYKRRLAKKKSVGIPQFLNLNERNELAVEIESVTLGLRDCSQKILVEGNISDSAFKKLIEFLVQNRNLHDELVERLLIVKNKMVPFEKFLQETELIGQWLMSMAQEINDTFHLLEQSLLTFQDSMEKEKETKCKESFSILPVMIGSLRRYEKDLMEKIIELESRIDTITSRYELYVIGGFKAEIGSSFIISRLPKMKQNEPAVAATSRPESSTSNNTLNHENVPPCLLRFLFYFLLFPVGKEIPYRRLSAVWIAEGIVGPKGGEYICRLRLGELIRRRLVVPTRRKLDGYAKAFKLRDTKAFNLRETLSRMAEATNFFKDDSNMTFRLTHYDDTNTSCYEHINGSKPCSSYVLKSHYKEVISFFSFDTTEGRKHGENIGNFLHRCIANGCFKLMRVLDLERVFKPKLPPAVGALTGLRYLGLRWTYLERLPDHVSMLLNLQVLDIKRTYISTLPKSIWNMQYLRHLYLSETYRSRFISRPRNSEPLDDLLTLWGAFIDEDSPVVNGLDTILNVRKLGLTCRSMSSSTEQMKSQLEAVGDWIIKLKRLQDLRLKSFDDLNKPSDIHVKSFSGNKSLFTVYLVGRLRYPTILSEFPSTITDITLSGSELENDPMVALQNLPNLLILRLLAASTKCSKMKCTRTGFPELRVLKLWSLENWDEWQLEKGALPRLEVLEIRNCHKLEMIPREIRQLQFLSKLIFDQE